MEDQSHTKLYCADLLTIPSLYGANILAGKGGLHKEITRVNVMEVPDIIDWVRPGEFLVTTGYPFRSQPEEMVTLIPQLHERGVTAMGIKTKRFIDKVPPAAIQIAEQLHFTLIELPSSTVFSDVVRDVMGRVLVHEARDLALLQNRIQRLSIQLLEGLGLDELLLSLEEMLGNPVVLFDSMEIPHLTAETKRLLSPELAELPWKELQNGLSVGTMVLSLGGRKVQAYLSEVPMFQRNSALLMLLEWNKESNLVDRLTIDQVTSLTGMELKNANIRRAVEEKYIDQFIQDWLAGRIQTLSNVLLRASASGVRLEDDVPGTTYQAAIIRFIGEKPSKSQLKTAATKLIQSGKQAEDDATLFTILDGELVAVVRSAPEDLKESPQSTGHSVLEPFVARIHESVKHQISVCLGMKVSSPELLCQSYEEAQRIRHISNLCSLDAEIITWEQLGIYSLLYLLPQGREMGAFMSRFIQPLAAYDHKLIETLQAYFEAKGNIRATADLMFTHYNTVVYRLQRIGEILNVDLEDPEIQLQLQIALKLYPIYGPGGLSSPRGL